MTAPVFVDTNVFVYRFDLSEPDKQQRADRWLRHLWRRNAGRISVQVLQELYVTLTRKLDPGLPSREARALVRSLQSWNPLPVGRPVLEAAWEIEDRYRLSWWGSLIVAAARSQGCGFLLTEDLAHGQMMEDVLIINPFKVDPEVLPATGAGRGAGI